MSLNLSGVLEAVAQGRGLTEGSWPWTVKYLTAADQVVGGRWRYVDVPLARLREVVLAPHAGEPCQGDTMELVPAAGATVAATARRLAAEVPAYSVHNATCWGRIERALAEPFSTVVLSTHPLSEAGHSARGPANHAWFVLDGFHRLVAWERAGRLTDSKPVRVIRAG